MSTKKNVESINDQALFSSIRQASTPVKLQRVIESAVNKRDNEESYSLWIHKDLNKDLKLMAAEEGSDRKTLIIEAIKLLRKQRGRPDINI